MAEAGYGICVTGATSLLGQEVLGALAKSPIALRVFHPVDALSVETTELSFRKKMLTVGLLNPEVLDEVDMVLVAAPVTDEEAAMLDSAAEAGCLVLDMVGYRKPGSGTPLLFGRSAGPLEALRETGAGTCPGALALALVGIGAAIRPLGLAQIRGTAMMSASIAGEKGVRELSGQVAALFNSQTPPRAVFEHGLAFDLLPGWGKVQASGWMESELVAAAQASRVLGLPPGAIAVDQVLVPMFVGLGLSLQIYGQSLSVESVSQAVDEFPGLQLFRQLEPGLMPRGMAGSSELAVGRVRPDPAGQGIQLFVAGDPMRLPAANAVQALLGMIELDLV
jgi:aspartate-semialdehyde dehydrogenase